MTRYPIFHVMGLQRTGTNWIKALIHHNLHAYGEVKGGNRVPWKHLTPLGVRENCSYNYINAHQLNNPNVFFVAVSKEFDIWVESMERWKVSGKYDFLEHNLPPGSDEHKYRVIYDSWMSWKDSMLRADNFYYQPYEYWYDNWQTCLDEISEKASYKKRNSTYEDLEKVPMSKKHIRKK